MFKGKSKLISKIIVILPFIVALIGWLIQWMVYGRVSVNIQDVIDLYEMGGELTGGIRFLIAVIILIIVLLIFNVFFMIKRITQRKEAPLTLSFLLYGLTVLTSLAFIVWIMGTLFSTIPIDSIESFVRAQLDTEQQIEELITSRLSWSIMLREYFDLAIQISIGMLLLLVAGTGYIDASREENHRKTEIFFTVLPFVLFLVHLYTLVSWRVPFMVIKDFFAFSKWLTLIAMMFNIGFIIRRIFRRKTKASFVITLAKIVPIVIWLGYFTIILLAVRYDFITRYDFMRRGIEVGLTDSLRMSYMSVFTFYDPFGDFSWQMSRFVVGTALFLLTIFGLLEYKREVQ